MQVHIDRNGERYGPYSIEEINACLSNSTLLPTDLAWQDGMTDWLPISQISGVVIPGGSVAASAPSSQSVPNGNKKKILIGIGAGVGVLAIIAGIWFFFIREEGKKEQLANNNGNNSTVTMPVKEPTKEAGKPQPVPPELAIPSKPLPAELVTEWEKAGFVTGWTEPNSPAALGNTSFTLSNQNLNSASVPAFMKNLIIPDEFEILGSLPAPQQSFGLNLFSSDITDEGLTELAKFQHLTSLDLGNNFGITDAGIAEISKLKRLTMLNLGNCIRISDKGIVEIAKLAQLKELSLWRTQITDRGLKEVRELKHLQILLLGTTRITNEGLKELSKLNQLKKLSLSGISITDEGLKELAKLKQLSNLDLYGTQITNTGLKEIARLQQLSWLDLRRTQVTKAQIAELQKALPKCKIFSNLKK